MPQQIENGSNTQDLSQQEHNQNLLHNAELGVFLERAYIDAINQDPRLADIEIVNLEESDTGLARAMPAWSSETGKHQIHIRLDNLDEALKRHQDSLDAIPGARELLSSKMGINPDDITPASLHIFSVLHEMGHLTEYMDHEDNPDALRQRIKKERAALPIGNTAVSAIMTEGAAARDLVERKWSEINEKHGVDTIDELLELQHTAYRDMTSESVADNFAADVFATNPDLVGALLSTDIVEEYRDYGMDIEGGEAYSEDPVDYAVDYAIEHGRTSIDLDIDLESFKVKINGLVRSIRSTAESEGRELSDKETNKIRDIVDIVSRQNEVIKRLKDRETQAA